MVAMLAMTPSSIKKWLLQSLRLGKRQEIETAARKGNKNNGIKETGIKKRQEG